MRRWLCSILLLISAAASASQEQSFMLRDYKHRATFTTYQAPNMTRKALGPTARAMRNCKQVDRLSFIKNEKLAYDANIAGAFYCAGRHGLQAYVVVRRFKKSR